jgi:hypothetical protein
MPEPLKHSNTSASLIVGLAAAVILALGVGVLVYSRQPSPPSAVASAAPPPAAQGPGQPAAASSAPSGSASTASPSAVSSAKTPATAPRPSPSGSSANSARKSTAGQPPAAASLGGSRGTAGAPPPLSVQAMMRRGFVPSRSAAENAKGVSKDLAGFDAKRSKDVKIKRAAEVDGRIEFSTTPTRVKPGDKYHVRISLVNEGKRAIDIKELVLTTRINRKESSAPVKPLVKQVAARQNEVIHEFTGSWDKATTSWAIEVRLMSGRLDVYRNELNWK